MKKLSPLLALLLTPYLGCSPGGEGTTSSDLGPVGVGQARLVVAMKASNLGQNKGKNAVSEIMVTIDEVSAHAAGGGGWVVVNSGPVNVDILRLADHAIELGFAELPPGKITQIRLHVMEGSSSYVTTPDGAQHPLKVPSGEQSGIKLKGLWDLKECASTQVTVSFDKKNSIHVHSTGHDDQWILRPVIKAGGSNESDVGCDPNLPPGNHPGGDPNNPGGDDPNVNLPGSDPTFDYPSGDPNDPNNPNNQPGPYDPNDPGSVGDPNNPGDPNDPTDPSYPGTDPSDPGFDPDNPGGSGDPDNPGGSGDPDNPGSGTTDPNDPNGGGVDPDDPNSSGGGDEPPNGNDPNDPYDPNDPANACQTSSDCGPAFYCSEAGQCIPEV